MWRFVVFGAPDVISATTPRELIASHLDESLKAVTLDIQTQICDPNEMTSCALVLFVPRLLYTLFLWFVFRYQ